MKTIKTISCTVLGLLVLSSNALGADFSNCTNNSLPSFNSYDIFMYGNATSDFWEHNYHTENGVPMTHTGKDFQIGNNSNHVPIYSYGFGKVIAVNDSYNAPTIRHLMDNGEYVKVNLLHQQSLNVTANTYITKCQLIGKEGNKGLSQPNLDANTHLHFEVAGQVSLAWVPTSKACPGDGCSDSDRTTNFDIDNLTAHYKITSATEKDTPFNGRVWYDPDVFSTHSEAMPYLSRSSTVIPSFSNYDVYGIANKPIYGSLNLTGTFQESSIKVVKNPASRSNITLDSTENLDDAHRYWGGKHESLPIAGLTTPTDPQTLYGAGNYIFAAYVKNDNENRYGYPVKFSFVDEGGVIVDNDQKSLLKENTNIISEPTYGNPTGGSKVPGYFLTADLHSGRSDKTAFWMPYKKGDYQIKVHIPEYGATATQVRYVIKPKGNGANQPVFTTKPINQTANKNGWVKLVAENGIDTFQFDDKGYVVLSLGSTSGTTNYNAVTSSQKVAFDAIKFDATWISRYSTLSGASEWLPSSQVVSNGILKLPVNNAPNSYFWSEHRLNLLKDYSASNFKLTAKVKNPSSEGGISAYDLCMSVDNSAKTGLGKGVCFMGESWAVSYTGIGGNGSWNTNRSQLVRDLSDWHTIALEGIGNTLSVYYDDVRVDTITYSGLPDNFNILSITGKGSHSIDSVTLVVNGQTVKNCNLDQNQMC
jgi:murein DD-endopeptidase MepM/ murein hydrolase activator NlpD